MSWQNNTYTLKEKAIILFHSQVNDHYLLIRCMYLLGTGQLLKPCNLIGPCCLHLLFHVDFHMVLVYSLQLLPKTRLHRYDIIKRNAGWLYVKTELPWASGLHSVYQMLSIIMFSSKFKVTHGAPVSLWQHHGVGTVTTMLENRLLYYRCLKW